MELTREVLQQYVYNPNMVQKLILDQIESGSNGELVVSDPTNPFTMLLEAAAVTSYNSLVESKNVIRKKYPNLAVRSDELYHHITDDELSNMFAIPAEVHIVFYVNILNLKTSGYRPIDANYIETTIPHNTEVIVLDTPLTLLNDIVIRLYDNNSIYVEQHTSSIDIAYADVGIIPSTVITDNSGIPWILFETKVKQCKRINKNIAVSVSEGFNQIITATDKYFYSDVKYKNSYTNNQYYPIYKTHSDEYLDPVKPTVYVSIYEKDILFRIPDMYLVDSGISGNVNIDLYETKGKIYLPINKYTFENFTITLGDTGMNESASTSTNIAILANSRDILEGGSNGMSTEELRSSIVFNTTGDIDLPVTDYQLSRYASMAGYNIYKITDIVTERMYIATNNLPSISSNLILAEQDVFFNTTKVLLEDIYNNPNINIQRNNFVIKSNTVFKYVNGIVTIVTEEELNYISLLSNIQKIEFFKTNKYFYTPYYYLITNDDKYTYSTVYDLDKPVAKDLKIVGKNLNIHPRANIDKFTIIKIASGYRLVFTIIANEEFKNIPTNQIGVQLVLPLVGNNLKSTHYATYDTNTQYYSVDIITNLFIEDENIDLLSGVSNVYDMKFSMKSIVNIYLYTTDITVVDNTGYLLDEIIKEKNKQYTVISKETLNIDFGNKLEYIWNRLYNTYTERKFLKYTYNVPLTYEEDVYDIKDNGSIYECVTKNGVTEIVYDKIYSKGDNVLDSDSNIVYKHKIGDVVLDSNGLPTIDTIAGVVRYIDILMLEYEFKLSSNTAYVNYKDSILDILSTSLLKDIPDLNNKLLENTKLVYKSYKTCKNIVVSINNVFYSAPFLVKPTITLYINSTNILSNDDIYLYKSIIGKVINKHFNNQTIILEDIRNDIIASIGNIVAAVKITDIDSINSEVINIKDKTNRLTLSKELDIDKNNDLLVKYDLTVIIQYV